MMLFYPHPIGTRLVVGVDASFWIGRFAGIINGVAILRDAQLFANVGKPVDGIRPLVRIPTRLITFVALHDENEDKDENENDGNDG